MIPVNQPLIAKNALKYVSECIQTGWISSVGPYIQRFERDFARYLGVKHAITTTSGTTALHLALASLGIGPGDEVIIPDLTMIAVPYAVLYTGASPVLVDVDPEIFNIDPAKIRTFLTQQCKFERRSNTLVNRTTQRTVRAILPVHLYGHPCEMDAIMEIAGEYDLHVIEDAAEALGALHYSGADRKRAKYAGTLGIMGCFSFYANKILTTGEGGMVVTDNDGFAEKARRLKDLAHSPKQRFLHTELAFNYRMTNLQAALGAAQLEEIERFIGRKQQMADAYRKLLSGIPGLRLPPKKEWARSVSWMYAVLVEKEFGLSREALMEKLREQGVDTRTFFIPVHEQPVFKNQYKGIFFPVSEELSREGFYLPSGLALTRSQIKQVGGAVRSIHKSLI